MSIKLNQITKFFGNQKVLDSITFEANPGDIVGLLGPNGAGKSTMMKIISGFYPQDTGSIHICGYNTQKNKLITQSHIGYLAEENPLYYDMFVIEFMEFICDIHKLNYSMTIDILKSTGLENVKNKKINNLSKGFKQRIGIAQAIIHNPDVIILDEPTSGLDPKQLIEIRKIITNIGQEKTILLSSHIIQEIKAVCNRIIMIDKGKIIIDKTLNEFEGEIEEKFLELTK